MADDNVASGRESMEGKGGKVGGRMDGRNKEGDKGGGGKKETRREGKEARDERGRRMKEKNKEETVDEWKERPKRGKILRSRGRVGLWCWASAALAPEKGGHHEVGGPPGPAPQPGICTTTRQMRFEGNDEKKRGKPRRANLSSPTILINSRC